MHAISRRSHANVNRAGHYNETDYRLDNPAVPAPRVTRVFREEKAREEGWKRRPYRPLRHLVLPL